MVDKNKWLHKIQDCVWMYGKPQKIKVKKSSNGNVIKETIKDGSLVKLVQDITSLKVLILVLLWMYMVVIKTMVRKLSNGVFIKDIINSSNLKMLVSVFFTSELDTVANT